MGSARAVRARSRGAGGSLRAFSGLLAGGLVALLVALGIAWYVADRTGTSGPGVDTLVWHVLAAVAAVLTQRYADRHPGAGGAAAAVAVIVIAAVLLTTEWFA